MDFEKVLQVLSARAAQSNHPQEVLRAPEIKTLYDHIKTLPNDERGTFGKRVNELKKSLEVVIEVRRQELDKVDLPPIDVTAPMDKSSSTASRPKPPRRGRCKAASRRWSA